MARKGSKKRKAARDKRAAKAPSNPCIDGKVRKQVQAVLAVIEPHRGC